MGKETTKIIEVGEVIRGDYILVNKDVTTLDIAFPLYKEHFASDEYVIEALPSILGTSNVTFEDCSNIKKITIRTNESISSDKCFPVNKSLFVYRGSIKFLDTMDYRIWIFVYRDMIGNIQDDLFVVKTESFFTANDAVKTKDPMDIMDIDEESSIKYRGYVGRLHTLIPYLRSKSMGYENKEGEYPYVQDKYELENGVSQRLLKKLTEHQRPIPSPTE